MRRYIHSSAVLGFFAATCLASACGSHSPVAPTPPASAPAPPSQVQFTVSGIVTQAGDADGALVALPGATINLMVDTDGAGQSAIANEDGWYSLAGLSGTVTISASMDGYETQTKSVELSEDTVLNFELVRAE